MPQANRRNPKYDRVRLWANFRERNSQTSDRHGNWSQHISIKLAKKPKIKAVSGVLSPFKQPSQLGYDQYFEPSENFDTLVCFRLTQWVSHECEKFEKHHLLDQKVPAEELRAPKKRVALDDQPRTKAHKSFKPVPFLHLSSSLKHI